MYNKDSRWILVILLTSCMVTLYVVYPRIIEELENKTLDFRFRMRGPKSPANDIVIVAIDELSLRTEGRWPWPRLLQARLIEQIKAAGARLILLDIFYSEPESPESDAALADAISKAAPLVAGLPLIVPEDVAEKEDDAQKNMQTEEIRYPDFLDDSAFGRILNYSQEKVFRMKEARNSLPPVSPIGSAPTALGHVYALPGRDGVLRREILALQFEGEFFPSLALQTARLALGLKPHEMALRIGEGIDLGEQFIPTDAYSRMLINFYGKEQTFPHIPASDVLRGQISKEALAGKIVLVGTTAMGTFDQKVVPFSNNYPGVEKNATVLSNILQGEYLHQSWDHKIIDLVTIVVLGLGVGLAIPRLKGTQGTVLTGGILVCLLAWLQGMFVWKGWWLNAVMPTGTLLLTYTAFTLDRYLHEEKKAREVRQMFASYVSPMIVEELVRNPEKARLGGQRKEVTILFSDICGFTSFSEKYDPETVVTILNEYLTAMTEVVFRWNGTLDKFIGDSIMVFWGAPIDQPRHAERAVRCALHMTERLKELQETWRSEGKPVLNAGIGINTGSVIVGNMGAEGKKMDYTVIGDPVNLAARLESQTRKQETDILISEFTHRQIASLVHLENGGNENGTSANAASGDGLGHIQLREVPGISVKGKSKTVTIYELENLPDGKKSYYREQVFVGNGN